MKYGKEILRGLLIGIAGIAPGVSGGALAVSMGVYDRIIYAVTHLLTEPKDSIKTLFPYGLGAATGICGLSFVIEGLFLHYPFAASMAFIGLILGGFPAIQRKAAEGENRFQGYCAFLIVFCLMIVLVILEGELGRGNADLSALYQGSTGSVVFVGIGLFCAGLIGAAATVIPGVSGTMLLMMLGYYQPLLSSFNRLQTEVFTGNFCGILREQPILLPYLAGLMAGIFLCAHMVESLLKNYEGLTYSMIMALILSSPVVILWNISYQDVRLAEILVGILLAVLGLLAASGLEH